MSKKMKKDAVVIYSGGMDSSICLALAIEAYGKNRVASLSFAYQQRHSAELVQAAHICKAWEVDHLVVTVEGLCKLTDNAQINNKIEIVHLPGQPPNTLFVGRNGLMARLGAIYADHVGANCIYMGVMGLEVANSGYRDCSREYFDLKEKILRMDLDNPNFEIRTPLVDLDKPQSLAIADRLGVLDFLLAETITCYEGVRGQGCKVCPACKLRNDGIANYFQNR
jgi:7-cyano-7-deazaguanine synthase